MLLNPKSALHIPVAYWLKAMPWLLRFVRSAEPSRVAEISDALSRLYHPAIERHREILAEIGALDLIKTTGHLHIYRNARQLAKDRMQWKVREQQGVRIEMVDRAALHELEPEVSNAYQLAVFLPDHGMSLNPERQATVVAEALMRRGVVFAREAVTGFRIEGQRVTGVVTSTGPRAADSVVVAAGAWSAQLLQSIGYNIPLETQRGYHIDLPEAGVTLSRPVIPADRKVFITPMEDCLRVAGTVEIAGLEAPPTAKRARLLLGDLAAVFPQARTERQKPFWMGHRPCLPDSLPVIGPSAEWGGLWFGFGHGHLGLTASAVTGDLIARSMLGPKPNIDMAPYSAERFS
jgi:D-amino-acid dehydrogenase